MNFSPPPWAITILAALAGAMGTALVKSVVEFVVAHWSPTARLKKAERASKLPAAVAGPAWPLPGTAGGAPSPDLQLLASAIEMVRLKQELSDTQAACVDLRQKLSRASTAQAMEHAEVLQLRDTVEQLQRLRTSHDKSAFENARLSGQLAAERESNLRLLEEMKGLRQGEGLPTLPRVNPKHVVDPQFAVERVRAGTHQPETVQTRPASRKSTKAGQ